MGGFVIKVDNKSIYLEPRTLVELLDTGVIAWPETTEADIMDHSKADWILKSLALVQVTWFVTQIVGRAVQGLPVTTLELFTLGIISCASLTYSVWWAKPFDIRKPTTIEPKENLPHIGNDIRRVSLLSSSINTSDSPTIVAALVTIVFGALHLVGWRFQFPTDIEMWLWRATSIACVALPFALVGQFYLEDTSSFPDWIGWPLLGFYFLCRLYMFVEMFSGLRSVPADVYKTPQWSQYLPSFG